MPHITLKKIAATLLVVVTGLTASNQAVAADPQPIIHTDSVLINFHQSKWNLDPDFADNAAALAGIDSRLSTVVNDSIYRLRSVKIYGGASPEGSVEFNKFLSEHRAETLFGWFDKYGQLADLDKTFTFYGRDWEGVLRLAQADPNIPFANETLALLRSLAAEKRLRGGQDPVRSLERLKQLRGGTPYRYLYSNIFPTVRASKVVIEYDHIPAPEPAPAKPDPVVITRIIEVRDTVYVNTCE